MGHKIIQSKTIESRTDFYYYAFRSILLISVPLVIISALVLGLPHSSATSSGTDNVQLVLSTSCTVNAVVTAEHTVSLNGGQLDNNVGNTKLSAFCNDNNGYSIYAVGSSGDIDGNTDLVNTVNESYNIHTGVYNGNNASNPSSWAMKLTAGTGTGIDPTTGGPVPTTPPTIIDGFDNYSTIPNAYTQVAKRTSGTSMTTDTSISGSYLDTTYQIYANSAQPAGTYNGKVKYVIIHPSSSNNTISDIDAAFAAVGKQKAYQDTDGNYYYAMQDMNPIICASVDRTGEITTTQLVDKRDNNLYYVTKEKDGNCWMTQNLDLSLNNPGIWPLTSEDTDLNYIYDSTTTPAAYPEYNTDYTKNSAGVISWTPDNIMADATVDYINNTVTGWNNSSSAPRSAEGGSTYIYTNGATGNTPDYIYDSLKACVQADHVEAECKHYHVGNYYNWAAAIASSSSSNASTKYYNAANSICPKGWRLPIATSEGDSIREFGKLLADEGIVSSNTAGYYAPNGFIAMRKTPLWFARSGFVNNGAMSNAASGGNYWSSTANSGVTAFYTAFNSGGVNSANYGNGLFNDGGASVRCLARSAGE